MNPQEITRELEHPGARNLLESATLLRLAYDGGDGFPRVIPIGFLWKGSEIVVCTAATAPKVEALSSRPHVPDEYITAATKVMDADQVTEFERQVGSKLAGGA
jgi:nitroimidazol reductase NimA-like FMN-containing flavoprotein (pyridoxamine 5'-phosphate oxidase superfamily)